MSTASAEAQQNQTLSQNRLTIGFLMLWTLCSAVFLATNRALEDSSPVAQRGLAYTVYLTFYALIQGLALASWPWFLARRLARREGFPTQPGHWLLLVRGMAVVAMLVGWGCRVAIERSWSNEGPARINLYLTTQYLPMATVAFVGYLVAWRQWQSETRLWRVTLGLLVFNAAIGVVITLAAIGAGSPAAGSYIPYSCNAWCINPVIGIFMIWAALRDHGANRDFFHWAGVLSALGIIALPFLFAWIVNVSR